MPSLRPMTGVPNVAVPQGAIYPNGVGITPPDPSIQGTTRPEGAVFVSSPGYATVRPGKFRLSPAHSHGPGIHFTPQRFAEDVGEATMPLMVDKTTAADHVDIADLPNSDRLDDNGSLSNVDARAGEGVMLSESNQTPTRPKPMHGEAFVSGNQPRPLSGKFWQATLKNPIKAFRSEYADSPVAAVLVAGACVGLAYALATEFERSYSRRRRPGDPVAAVGTVPAAGVAAAGTSVKEATSVVNDSVTAAGKAADEAVSAAGDAVEAAGKAAETITEAAADAAT